MRKKQFESFRKTGNENMHDFPGNCQEFPRNNYNIVPEKREFSKNIAKMLFPEKWKLKIVTFPGKTGTGIPGNDSTTFNALLEGNHHHAVKFFVVGL